jgi:hypothetical protein
MQEKTDRILNCLKSKSCMILILKKIMNRLENLFIKLDCNEPGQ